MVGKLGHPKAIKLKADNKHITLEEYGTIGWAYLETKNYKEAKEWLSRGVQLYTTDLVLLGNLRHIELFTGDYGKAMKV